MLLGSTPEPSGTDKHLNVSIPPILTNGDSIKTLRSTKPAFWQNDLSFNLTTGLGFNLIE